MGTGTANQYQNLFESWTSSSPGRRETTVAEYRNVLLSFARTVDGKSLGEITRQDIVRYRDHLLQAGQSTTTAGRKVGMLRTLFVAGLDHELLGNNPAGDVRVRSRQGGKRRVAFAAEDLIRIFTSEIYTTGSRPRGGGREAAYWLPLLALFTGARIEELAQLRVADIRRAAGLGYYLDITDAAEHAHLKNASARRRIPVHAELLACGLIAYVQDCPSTGPLFPHLKRNPRDKLGGYFSNFFSGYLRRKIGIEDRRKVFHSFRHTFKDTCRQVGIEEAVHDALTGHTTPAVGRLYGNEQYPLEPLFAAMERFVMPKLDLSHLHVMPCPVRQPGAGARMIAAFYGIVVAFAAPGGATHTAPHVVALHAEMEAGIDIATNQVIYGQLPDQKLILVRAWIEIHREELITVWQAGRLTGEYFRLEPLR